MEGVSRRALDNVLSVVQKKLRRELLVREDMGADERKIVENRLLRAQQLVFDKNPEFARMGAVDQFRKKHNKSPNFDNPRHLIEVDKYAREIGRVIKQGKQ